MDFEYEVAGGEITITKYIGSAGEVTVPSSIDGLRVTRIGDEAFAFCGMLSKVTLPECLRSIGRRAFNGCVSLRQIMLPRSVVFIGFCAFALCEIRVIAHFPPGYYSYNPDHDVDWLMPEHFGNFS